MKEIDVHKQDLSRMNRPSLPDTPKSGLFKVMVDNSPFPLLGKSFSYQQILRGLRNGTFQPGMKFRHARMGPMEFALTVNGLVSAPREISKSRA